MRIGIALALAALGCATPQSSGEPRDGQLSPRTQVVLLGTGTPNADPERMGPSTAVVVDGVPYLVDCGPGVVRRCAQAAAEGVAGLAPERLERVFLTHLHSDHTVGLADLVYTPWVLERERPLQVFGPPGTANMAEHVGAAWSQDVQLRLNGLEPANPEGWRTRVQEISAGWVYEDERVRVRAIAVEHGSWPHAFGFRFDTPDRSVVISGDCRPSPALIEAAQDCDLLIHEVYSHEMFQTRPPVWQRYHAAFHTSTLELAEIALRARPKLLVLTHQLFWGAQPEDLLHEIRTRYEGPVVSGRDLDVY